MEGCGLEVWILWSWENIIKSMKGLELLNLMALLIWALVSMI